MSLLLQIGLSNALLATLLAFLALWMGRRCQRPAVVHSLWLLALLKLVTPPFVPLPIPWPTLPPGSELATAAVPDQPSTAAIRSAESPSAPPSLSQATVAPQPTMVPAAMVQGTRVPLEFNPPTPAAEPLAGNSASATLGFVWPRFQLTEATRSTLLAAWFLGTAAWFLLAAWRLWQFHRLLRHAEPAPAALQAQVQRLANRLELPRCPEVLLVPGALAPMIWAVGRARLLLPAGLMLRLPEPSQITLLVHELAHLRRRDHWVRWLEVVVLGLYWWYPPVWWMRRQLQAAEEECCDAWVVGELPQAGRTYASALLDTVDFVAENRPAIPLLASGIGEAHNLERRLRRIMRGRTPRALSGPGRLAWLALAVLLLPLVPTRVYLAAQPVPAPTVTEQPDTALRWISEAPAPAVPSALVTAVVEHRAAPSLTVPWRVRGDEHAVRFHDLATGKDLPPLKGRRSNVTSVAYSPNGRMLAVAGRDRTVQLYDTRTHELNATLTGHVQSLTAVAFSPDGRTLVSAGGDPRFPRQRGEVKLWDLISGREFMVLAGLGAGVFQVAFSPDGKLLATAGGDGHINVWDAARGEWLTSLKGHRGIVQALAFSPEGELLATAGLDGVLKLWETATWRERGRTHLAARAFTSMAFAPDGGTLATADNPVDGELASAEQNAVADRPVADEPAVAEEELAEPGVLRLWDPATLDPKAEFRGHNGKIGALAFSPEGLTLASVGSTEEQSGEVKLWSLAAEEERYSLSGPRGWIGSVAFSPDGKTLAIGSGR